MKTSRTMPQTNQPRREQDNYREWSNGLCDCCNDCGECKSFKLFVVNFIQYLYSYLGCTAYYLTPLFGVLLALRANEAPAALCFGSLHALRTKIRTERKIRVSLLYF